MYKKFQKFFLTESTKSSLSQEVESILNDQINMELYSEYAYLIASSWFKNENLLGLAKWTQEHSNEEKGHALKIIDHMHDRFSNVKYSKIDSLDKSWKEPYEVLETIFEHEQKVTKSLHNIAEKVMGKDELTYTLIHEMLKEQIEEEAVTEELYDKLYKSRTNYAAILMIDQKYV